MISRQLVEQRKKSLEQFDGEPVDSSEGKDMKLQGRESPPRKNQLAQIIAYHEIPTFQSIIKVMAEDLASASWQIVNGKDPIDHPAADALREPNPLMSYYDMAFTVFSHWLIVGEFFIVPMISSDGNRINLWPVKPMSCSFDSGREKGGGIWEVNSRDLDVRWQIPNAAMIWGRQPNLANIYGRGRGLGGVLADELEIVDYASEYAKTEFYNYGKPEMAIHLVDANKRQRKKFEKKWKNQYQGPENFAKPFFSSGPAEIQWKEISRTLAENNVLENSQEAVRTIERQENIPPLLMGRSEDVNRSTAEMQHKVYIERNIGPKLDNLAQIWDRQLFHLWKNNPDDIAFLYQTPEVQAKTFIQSHMEKFPDSYSMNEKRELTDHPPIEGGDVHKLPSSARVRYEDMGPIIDQENIEGGGASENSGRAQRSLESGCCGELPPGESKDEKPDDRRTNIVVKKKTRELKSGEIPIEAETLAEELKKDQIDDEFIESHKVEVSNAIEQEAQFIGEEDPEHLRESMNPRAESFSRMIAGEHIEGITRENRRQVGNIIADGLREGMGREAVRRKLEDQWPDIAKTRARTIAQTEMTRAQNHGRFIVDEQNELIKYKSWLTQSINVRPAHQDLGARDPIPIDSLWNYQGNTAMYPGDFGVAELDINCHCTHQPKLNKSATSDEEKERRLKQFDKSLRESQDRFRGKMEKILIDQVMEHVVPRISDVLAGA